MTLKQFSEGIESIPINTSWYLADIAEAFGKQQLFTRQSPQLLKTLREHALIESAMSSNRIEGVEVEKARVKPVILGKTHPRDRNEEEVRAYREALKLIHAKGVALPVSQDTVLKLHRISRGEIWDAGKYKDKDGDIIERLSDGKVRVRFKTVTAKKTPECMDKLVKDWGRCLLEKWVPPLIAVAAFNLDFLCVHPFRDGNGRVSRLLLLLQFYHLGFEVGRYISIERVIEENKDRYYETLEQSSQGWRRGEHDPWPYINYVLFILKTAYKEFEERVGQVKSPRGAKTELIERAACGFQGSFTVTDLERTCPGVSGDMIRKVLRNLKEKGKFECLGRGPGAPWKKRG